MKTDIKKSKKKHLTPKPQSVIFRLIKKSFMPLAIFIIIMALLFSLFRALTPLAKQYKGKVEHHLSILLGQPVTINDLETSWYWFQPVLKMNQVTLSNQQDQVLKLNKLLVGIDLLSSLWHWQIQPGVLYVEDVHLTLRQINRHWDVDGLSHNKQSVKIETDSYLPALGWILSQEKIILKHVSILIYLRDGTLIPIQDLNLITRHAYGHYRIKGTAKLDQKTPTALTILADMQLDPYDLKTASGHFYVSLAHVLPAQWQGFFPETTYHIKAGEGNVDLWLDVVKGRFLSLQSTLDFEHIKWSQDGRPKKHTIQFLKGNLAWRTNQDGWQMSADQIKLSLDGVNWPENALSLNYKKSQHTYRAFLKTLSLESVFATDIDWPDSLYSILSSRPSGNLFDTQISLKEGKPDYFLTRFTEFGWQGWDDVPSVSQISGVLYWQPTEGRLELDGENTIIKPKNSPKIAFDQLTAALDWKKQSTGLRINMERFVLSRPDLVLSAQGALDEPFLPSANLRMTAEFSAHDAKHWLNYIPSRYLKPKLDTWLKHNIKRVAMASGRLVINGPLAEFPFDNQLGEFYINSYLSGVDLSISKQWPLSRDIAAHLSVDKRQLEADIFHAQMKEVVFDKMNLVVNNIGLGDESLLIHGDITAPAEKMKDLVYASPIGARLSKWSMLDIHDSLALDLRLEIPLYPASDHVFARGSLLFDNNDVVFHHDSKEVLVDQLSGALNFDEYGVTQSQLSAKLADDPISINVKSIKKPKSYTEVNMKGATSINVLKQQFSLPFFSAMKGHFDVSSTLMLTDNPKISDHIRVDTSLEGVTIDLPLPLGKSPKESVPLSLDVSFTDSQVNLDLKYKDMRVQANKITKDAWTLRLEEQAISADLRYQILSNTLSGHMKWLYLPKELLLNTNNEKSMLKPTDIPNLNLTFSNVKLDNVDIGSVFLKTNSKPNVWMLEQCKVNSPDYQLSVQGSWRAEAKINHTDLQASLELLDLGKALARWGIIPAVEAHRGEVVFKGGWPGAISNFKLEKVAGDIQINLKKGRITHLDKSTEEKLGLGKLLSVLSLQTIPRRLKLDFSDLSEDGYSFDEFKGSFSLKNGVMNTQDSYIDGPVAYASMKGDLDLVKHLYDVDLRVSPYIMASLPVVVTIAGGPIAGPIAGIATWVASKIINKGIQQISAYTYKISGPWLDPVVQQVRIYKKK